MIQKDYEEEIFIDLQNKYSVLILISMIHAFLKLLEMSYFPNIHLEAIQKRHILFQFWPKSVFRWKNINYQWFWSKFETFFSLNLIMKILDLCLKYFPFQTSKGLFNFLKYFPFKLTSAGLFNFISVPLNSSLGCFISNVPDPDLQ